MINISSNLPNIQSNSMTSEEDFFSEKSAASGEIRTHAGFYLEILFWGGNMVDNFKDSKKGHNTPVGAFATSQL